MGCGVLAGFTTIGHFCGCLWFSKCLTGHPFRDFCVSFPKKLQSAGTFNLPPLVPGIGSGKEKGAERTRASPADDQSFLHVRSFKYWTDSLLHRCEEEKNVEAGNMPRVVIHHVLQ